MQEPRSQGDGRSFSLRTRTAGLRSLADRGAGVHSETTGSARASAVSQVTRNPIKAIDAASCLGRKRPTSIVSKSKTRRTEGTPSLATLLPTKREVL